jgi:hypothetical protein
MDFGQALTALKAGGQVFRAGWNGKGMWLEYVDDGRFGPNETLMLPFIVMRTVQGDWVPWLASQTDMLAEDWEVA